MKPSLPIEKLQSIYHTVAGRYDLQHRLLTASSDQRGRRLLVENAIQSGDKVLDCGAGTGSTGLLAAQQVGARGSVTLFDLSPSMLEQARLKFQHSAIDCDVALDSGDMLSLPYPDNTFDAVLSTYSLCPLADPALAAKEIFRVTRPGGKIGVAHSAEPSNRLIRLFAAWVEKLIWKFPSLSLGCRAINVLPEFQRLGCELIFDKKIGIPLWPFEVFVLRKLND